MLSTTHTRSDSIRTIPLYSTLDVVKLSHDTYIMATPRRIEDKNATLMAGTTSKKPSTKRKLPAPDTDDEQEPRKKRPRLAKDIDTDTDESITLIDDGSKDALRTLQTWQDTLLDRLRHWLSTDAGGKLYVTKANNATEMASRFLKYAKKYFELS
jgi:hypothetical protein